MSTRRWPQGDTFRNSATLLDAMAHFRKVLTDAQKTVRPMGAAYHAGQMVVKAIDALATFITGHSYYYSAGGSAPTGEAMSAPRAERNWHEDRLRFIAERDARDPDQGVGD